MSVGIRTRRMSSASCALTEKVLEDMVWGWCCCSVAVWLLVVKEMLV